MCLNPDRKQQQGYCAAFVAENGYGALLAAKPCLKRQSGFTIVTAIFLVVILAALGGFIVTLSTVQHSTQAKDVQGARAYQAAHAGIEWGAYQAVKNNSCVLNTAMPALAGLNGFAVIVQCNPFPTVAPNAYSEGANTVRSYRVIATAMFGAVGSPNFIDRQLQVTVSTCTDPAGQPC